jgi:hypothetical protein
MYQQIDSRVTYLRTLEGSIVYCKVHSRKRDCVVADAIQLYHVDECVQLAFVLLGR